MMVNRLSRWSEVGLEAFSAVAVSFNAAQGLRSEVRVLAV